MSVSWWILDCNHKNLFFQPYSMSCSQFYEKSHPFLADSHSSINFFVLAFLSTSYTYTKSTFYVYIAVEQTLILHTHLRALWNANYIYVYSLSSSLSCSSMRATSRNDDEKRTKKWQMIHYEWVLKNESTKRNCHRGKKKKEMKTIRQSYFLRKRGRGRKIWKYHDFIFMLKHRKYYIFAHKRHLNAYDLQVINSKSIWWCKSSIWCRLNVRSC